MFFYFDFYECCHEAVCEIKHVFFQNRCLFPQLEFENKTDQDEWDLVQIVEFCPQYSFWNKGTPSVYAS